MRAATLAPWIGLGLAVASAPRQPLLPPITVSAAVSLTDVLQAEAMAYTQAGGGTVRFNFGPSNTLARQILAGAPVDLFISADEAQMNVVARGGLVAGGSRVDLLGNQLAVVVPDDRRRVLGGLRDLLDPAFERIAIGDPAAVPAGVYAKQCLQRAGLWDRLRSRVVPSASVRAALAAVDSGSADVAIVYRTDVRVARHSTIAFVVPVDRAPTIVYPAAIVTSGRQPEGARRFLDFLRGEAGAVIFRRFDFTPAPHG
ncbi:MAG TPA: molybdate ABC transporter substrate-binding protein [Vicinamibacterales bacterium]|nr:molybdate ABC transporter substrate-binding protein [Vicinamibacterales bacterium]